MPFGIKGETPAITARMEKCVAGIKGVNKKTGKPYTEGEKIAICKTSLGFSEDLMVSFSDLEFDEKTKTSTVEILKVGKWDGSKGKFSITNKTFDNFIKNFKSKTYGSDLQVNFGHERDGQAAGWFKDLFAENGKLKAVIEWTSAGIKALKDKIYRYFSAELAFEWQNDETGEKHEDVLLGGALTNIPYIRGLQPIALSENLSINLNDMKVFDTLLAELQEKDKVTKEEKASIRKLFETLDEEVKEEVKADVEEVEKKEEPVEEVKEEKKEEEKKEIKASDSISMSEHKKLLDESIEKERKEHTKTLSDVVKKVNMLQSEIEKKDMSEKVEKELLCSETTKKGFRPKAKDKVVEFMMSLSKENRKKFEELMEEYIAVDFSEKGADSYGLSDANTTLETEVKKLMEENKEMTYAEATKKVLSDNPTLEVK